MKKILVMGHIDGFGGAQTAFRQFTDFLLEEGYSTKLVVLTNKKKSEIVFHNNLIIGHVSHQPSGFIGKFRKMINLFWSGIGAKLFKPDIFVSVGLSNSSNFIVKFLNSDTFSIGQNFIADRSFIEALLTKSEKIFNGIAVQSPSMIKTWANCAFQRKMTWLPCFPEKPTSGIKHTHRNLEEIDLVKIGYFGRIAANKGLILLLKAFNQASSTLKISLDIWGSGHQEELLKELVITLNLTHKVRLLGKYPQGEEGSKLIASYDALVLPSTEVEGLPLILLEAMAYGLPFLTTNIGAIKDCCVNNPDAILVEPDEDSLTIGLKTVYSRISHGEFNSERLRNYYKANFSYEVMGDRWRRCLSNPSIFFSESEK